jgi:spermidine synthase
LRGALVAPERAGIASRLRLLAALGLMAASGVAALGYEIVWTHQNALWLGQETAAVLAVLAAFFGGLGIGAAALAGPITRAARPARWYAGCEIVIALWSLVLAFAMPEAAARLVDLVGAEPSPVRQWSVTFCGTFLVLLPATAAMGATLPAVERLIGSAAGRRVPMIGALYAANTLGAVAGVVLSAFWLVPALGLVRTALVCVALNLLCAALALCFLDERSTPAEPVAARRAFPALAALACTGLLGIGYEVLGVRVLSQAAEDTVYTFAILLAIYLAGTALGAAAYQRWRIATPEVFEAPDRWRGRLLLATAVALLVGMLGLATAPALKSAALEWLGESSFERALAVEAVIAVAAFLPPTIATGALFSHLCVAAKAQGVSFGLALGVNTLGAALAPLVFGVGLVPAIGLESAVLIVVAGYLALAAPRHWRTMGFAATAIAAVAVALIAPPLAFVDVPEGGRVVRLEQGATATVSVVEDASGVARLHIDNHQQEGSSGTLYADARQALLPLLLHPAPRRALFLGLGTGITASAAAQDRSLEVHAVELLPEVIAASASFRDAFPEEDAVKRLHVLNADARRFVRTATETYDIIVADNFHPARSGSGALYTVEHFEAVRGRLAPGGLFCQWLPLHQLDLDSLRSIVRAFLAAWPRGWAMLATHSLETPVLGLVARRDGERLSVEEVGGRVATLEVPGGVEAFGLGEELAVLGSFVGGPRALTAFAADAPLNTDDRPIVAWRAPRITYDPDSLPRERLIALLRELSIAPSELVDPRSPETQLARLSAYWRARNLYIEAGQHVVARPDARAMLEQVREPLLAVLRVSADFRPAYDPLLALAVDLGREDVTAARELLAELLRIAPRRNEAAAALAALGLADDQVEGR